jgi:CBS domain-containing protein
MLTLHDIMTTDLVTVSPEMNLHELAEVFASRKISGAPVVAGMDLVGVISSSDLLDFESTHPGSPRHRPEQSEWGELEDAREWEGDDSPPSYYFTDFWPDAGADVLERIETSDGPEWNHLGERTVAEAMTPSVWALQSDTTVRDAARVMLDNRIHRVLVVDAGRLIGIVSSSDIVRAVADKGLCD